MITFLEGNGYFQSRPEGLITAGASSSRVHDFSAGGETEAPSSSSQVTVNSPVSPPFCPIQVLKVLIPPTRTWEGPSALLSLPIQMLISSETPHQYTQKSYSTQYLVDCG